jgi:hypothetical protein
MGPKPTVSIVAQAPAFPAALVRSSLYRILGSNPYKEFGTSIQTACCGCQKVVSNSLN